LDRALEVVAEDRVVVQAGIACRHGIGWPPIVGPVLREVGAELHVRADNPCGAARHKDRCCRKGDESETSHDAPPTRCAAIFTPTPGRGSWQRPSYSMDPVCEVLREREKESAMSDNATHGTSRASSK